MLQTDRIQKILKASRHEFSRYGFSGARIDAISSRAKINKRLVYEYCQTKEGLYFSVLSDLSREAMAAFEMAEDRLLACKNVLDLYLTVVDILSPFHEFIRLWSWEMLSPTIHGPRLLESMDLIFERIENLSKRILTEEKKLSMNNERYKAIKVLCAGYLLASAITADNESDESNDDISEAENTQNQSHMPKQNSEISKYLYHSLEIGINLTLDSKHSAK